MSLVLLIEDEFVVGLTMTVQFESLGWDVAGWARTAEHGVELAEQFAQELDLIVVDLGLPGEDGIWAIKQIRRRRDLRKIPIIVATAYGGQHVEHALKAGASIALPKPVLEVEWAKTVSELLGAKG